MKTAASRKITPNTPSSTVSAIPLGCVPSSGRQRNGTAPQNPGIAMSIKGYPITTFPATALAVTPCLLPWSHSAKSAGIVGNPAEKRCVSTRRFWRNCVIEEPLPETTGGRSPVAGLAHHLRVLLVILLAFEVISSGFNSASRIKSDNLSRMVSKKCFAQKGS